MFVYVRVHLLHLMGIDRKRADHCYWRSMMDGKLELNTLLHIVFQLHLSFNYEVVFVH